MAKSKVFTTDLPAGDVSFNVIPLVDCAFLMILFFILTSQISSSSTSHLFLAKPTESQGIEAEKDKTSDKVIVNVISAEGDVEKTDPAKTGLAKEYQINGESIGLGDAQTLTKILKTRRAQSAAKGGTAAECRVVIRADWRVRYADIVPVLTAAADAGIQKMNISVLADK